MATVRGGLQHDQGPPRRSATLEPQPDHRDAALAVNGSLLSAEDVAALIGMTKGWVYTETRAGRIPHVKLGRYYRYRSDSIEAWLRTIENGTRELARRT